MKVSKKISGSCMIPVKDILDSRDGEQSGEIVLWLASKKGCPCVVVEDEIYIDNNYVYEYSITPNVGVCVVTWEEE